MKLQKCGLSILATENGCRFKHSGVRNCPIHTEKNLAENMDKTVMINKVIIHSYISIHLCIHFYNNAQLFLLLHKYSCIKKWIQSEILTT